MKNFSISRLADIILTRRKAMHLTQQQLADLAGMNRTMLCHLENQEYIPSMDQLSRLANALNFDVTDAFIEYNAPVFHQVKPRKIAVYGEDTAGISVATLLARQHQVILVVSDPEKAEQINRRSSFYEDDYIEKYLMSDTLDLTATADGRDACRNADYTVIAVPSGYSTGQGRFDTSAVEDTVEKVLVNNPEAVIVIRSSVPVGYAAAIREKYPSASILFSPDFSRKNKSLYDNLYPARIVVGCDETMREKAQDFAGIMRSSALKKDVEVLLTGPDEAESILLFSNTVLAMRRYCFNEIDSFAETRGLNAREIIKGICLDTRIGNHDNNPTFSDEIYGLPENMEQISAESDRIPERLLTAVTDNRRIRMDHIVDRVLRIAGITPEDYGRILSGEKRVVVGIYRLTGKDENGPIRSRAYQEIIMRLRARGVEFVIYEPLLENGSLFCGGKVINHLKRFKKITEVIMADYYHSSLDDVSDKVYTRDLFYDEKPER